MGSLVRSVDRYLRVSLIGPLVYRRVDSCMRACVCSISEILGYSFDSLICLVPRPTRGRSMCFPRSPVPLLDKHAISTLSLALTDVSWHVCGGHWG